MCTLQQTALSTLSRKRRHLLNCLFCVKIQQTTGTDGLGTGYLSKGCVTLLLTTKDVDTGPLEGSVSKKQCNCWLYEGFNWQQNQFALYMSVLLKIQQNVWTEVCPWGSLELVDREARTLYCTCLVYLRSQGINVAQVHCSCLYY